MESEIKEIRNRIVNTSITAFLILGILTHGIATIRAFRFGFELGYFLQIGVVIVFCVCVYYRRKLALSTKVYILAGSIFVVLISGMLRYGYFAVSKNYIPLLPIFVSLIWSWKRALYMLFLGLFIFGVFGIFFTSGLLGYEFDIQELIYDRTFWLLEILSLMLASIGILYIGEIMTGSLKKNLTTIETQNKQIKESEEKYHSILQNIPSVVYRCLPDKSWTMKMIGNKIHELSGYSHDDFLENGNRSFTSIILETDRNSVLEEINNSLFESGTFSAEYRIRRKDGAVRWVRDQGTAEYNAKQKIKWIDGFLTDITGEKTSQLALIKSEQKFRTLFINSGDAAFIMKKDMFIECNEQAVIMFGHSPSDLVNNHPWNLSPEIQPNGINSRELASEKMKKVVAGKNQIFEWTHLRSNGETFIAEVSLSVINQEEELFLALVRDISERKAAEQELRESEQRNQLIINNIPVVIWKSNQKGETVFISENVQRVYGYSPEEIYSNGIKYWLDRIHPEDYQHVSSAFSGLFSDTQPFDIEYRIQRKDGKWIWLHDFADHVIIEGEEIYAFGVFHEITERKEMEIALRNSEEKFRNIFNASRDGIMVSALDQKILIANNTSLDFLQSRNDISNRKVSEFVAEEDLPRLQERIELFRQGKNLPAIEMGIKKHDGSIVPVELKSQLVQYENKPAILSIFRDITERKELQKNLFRMQVESEEKERERYARELHDGLGPLISTCKIYFHSLQKQKDEQKRTEYLSRAGEILEEALRSIREISNNLSPHILRNYGLHKALCAFAEKLDNVSNIVFEIPEFNGRLPELIEITLYRTLVELINNSVKYGKPDKIVIDICADEKFVGVVYTEDGKGFDYEKILHEGRGFGLLNMKNRIEKSGGRYNYESTPGKGISVNFSLKI